MSEFGNTFKQLVREYNDSTSPTDFLFGTMIKPTQFQLDGTQGPIPESLTVIPDYLSIYKVKTRRDPSQEWSPLEIDNSLKVGDRVIILKKPGNKKYLILGRLQ